MENAGNGHLIPGWVPEPFSYIYMYNTPHFVNASFNNPDLKLITNFRDPRDLACNQFHWAQQHPVLHKSAEELEERRRLVAEEGIDAFVSKQDNNILFRSLRALEQRLAGGDQNILKLSYSQLCLDFDQLLESIIGFLGVDRQAVPWQVLERERTSNLENNPNWIGQVWTGSDIMPGRYRRELRPETIEVIDNRYRENLRFVRSLETPRLRPLLATEAERAEMERVLVGKNNELFLKNDANDTVGQITGKLQLTRSKLTNIGMEHRNRRIFGSTLANFKYCHALIPSKEVAHSGLLPDEISFEGYGRRPIEQYLEAGIGGVWQPYYQPELLRLRENARFFPQSDSHWNHAGALRYIRAFVAAELPELEDKLDMMPLRRFAAQQQSDLALKLELPSEQIEIIAPEHAKSRLVFENGVSNEGGVRWYKNGKAGKPCRALILHDGFTLWLLGILAELFSEAVFVHGNLFDYEFVQRLDPQFVICIQAERFFVRQPSTGGDMLAQIKLQEAEKHAVRAFSEAFDAEKLSVN